MQNVSDNSSLTYALCGLGTACSIATGKPSVERAALVRREALELALYTFKYIPNIKSVVAFMPPPAGTKPDDGRLPAEVRSDPRAEGAADAHAQPARPAPHEHPAAEQARVDAITGSKLYTFRLTQTQQGDLVFVLSPPRRNPAPASTVLPP